MRDPSIDLPHTLRTRFALAPVGRVFRKGEGVSPSFEHQHSQAAALIRRLAQRYAVILLAVATLIVVDQALLQPLLMRLDRFAPAINVAGRQRMLSQRLTKASLAFALGEQQSARQQEIRVTLSEWKQGHAALRDGDAARGIRPIVTPEIEQQWQQLEPHFQAMCGLAEQFLASDAGSLDQPRFDAEVRAFLSHEPQFLASMERIVDLFEQQAAREVFHLRAAALGIAAAVIILIISLGWLVLRPALRAIRRQVDNLETQVTQRTAQLARSNQDLRNEIAERQQAEARSAELAAQLAHVGRVMSIGHLTSSLAHELNQPLGAMANYAAACKVLLETAPEQMPTIRNHFDQIQEAALRAGQIVRRIRNFVQPQSTPNFAEIDIDMLIREVVSLCEPEASRRDVQLATRLCAGSARALGDGIQIQQVVVNLVQNGLDALVGAPLPRKLSISTAVSDGLVEIVVHDNGSGFAQAGFNPVKPFHTTKPDGLGIGLAICQTIVELHEGSIWVRSEPASGTSVHFTLPLATPRPAIASTEPLPDDLGPTTEPGSIPLLPSIHT